MVSWFQNKPITPSLREKEGAPVVGFSQGVPGGAPGEQGGGEEERGELKPPFCPRQAGKGEPIWEVLRKHAERVGDPNSFLAKKQQLLPSSLENSMEMSPVTALGHTAIPDHRPQNWPRPGFPREAVGCAA